MSNNVVLQDNLDDDAVVDTGKGKIRFESISHGTGAPSAPPAVPEKAWVYADKAEDPNALYVWDPVGEAWNVAGGAGGSPEVYVTQGAITTNAPLTDSNYATAPAGWMLWLPGQTTTANRGLYVTDGSTTLQPVLTWPLLKDIVLHIPAYYFNLAGFLTSTIQAEGDTLALPMTFDIRTDPVPILTSGMRGRAAQTRVDANINYGFAPPTTNTVEAHLQKISEALPFYQTRHNQIALTYGGSNVTINDLNDPTDYALPPMIWLLPGGTTDSTNLGLPADQGAPGLSIIVYRPLSEDGVGIATITGTVDGEVNPTLLAGEFMEIMIVDPGSGREWITLATNRVRLRDRTVTGATTVLGSDKVVAANTTAGGFAINLATLTQVGRTVTFDNIGTGANALTLTGTVSGVTNPTIADGTSMTVYVGPEGLRSH